jgi:hypothetical protein
MSTAARTVLGLVAVVLVCLAVSLALTGVAMAVDYDGCTDDGGTWTLDWPTATSTCSFGFDR